ncbi:MAG: sigma-70 family RNA polymerase sigma factor [Clostridium sp.]
MVENNSEKQLIKLAKAGNKDALEQLLKLHEGYIYKLILGHEVPFSECDNMFNYCVLGVMEAIKHFDVERDIKFLTYANGYILDALEAGMRESCYGVRIPRNSYKKYVRAKKQKITKTEKEFDIYLEDEGMKETYKCIEVFEGQGSLDVDDELINDKIPTTNNFDESSCNTILLDKYIEKLTKEQQKVIRYFYYEDKEIQEIMDIMDLKKYQVNYLKSSALKTLKSLMKEYVSCV